MKRGWGGCGGGVERGCVVKRSIGGIVILSDRTNVCMIEGG